MLELKVTFEKKDDNYYIFGVWEGEHEITHASFANPPIKNNWESAILLIATTVQGRLLEEKTKEENLKEAEKVMTLNKAYKDDK